MPRIHRRQVVRILTAVAVIGVILFGLAYRALYIRAWKLCSFENLEIVSFFDAEYVPEPPCETSDFTLEIIALIAAGLVTLVSLAGAFWLNHLERRAAAGEGPPHAPTFLPTFVRRIIDRIIRDERI